MKKFFFVFSCISYIFSLIIPLLLPFYQGFSSTFSETGNDSYAVILAKDIDDSFKAEEIFNNSKISGIVSLQTELAAYPSTFVNHPYYKKVYNWFVDASFVRFFVPWTKQSSQICNTELSNVLPSVSVISPLFVQQSKSFFYLIIAFVLFLGLIFFVKSKILFIFINLPFFAFIFRYSSLQAFLVFTFVLLVISGFFEIMNNRGFPLSIKDTFKKTRKVLWIWVFSLCSFVISCSCGFLFFLFFLLSVLGMLCAYYFYIKIHEFQNMKRIIPVFKPVSILCTKEKSEQQLSKGNFFIPIGAGLSVLAFIASWLFLTPDTNTHVPNPQAEYSFLSSPSFSEIVYPASVDGLKQFLIEKEETKESKFADLSMYLAWKWQEETWLFQDLYSLSSDEAWNDLIKSVPDSLYITRYAEKTDGSIGSWQEEVASFDNYFVYQSLKKLPPLEKWLFSFGGFVSIISQKGQFAQTVRQRFNYFLFFTVFLGILFAGFFSFFRPIPAKMYRHKLFFDIKCSDSESLYE